VPIIFDNGNHHRLQIKIFNLDDTSLKSCSIPFLWNILMAKIIFINILIEISLKKNIINIK